MQPTPVYRALLLECERRRQQLGVSMERFSEFAGLPDRAYGKMLWPDSAPDRKHASWESVQRVIAALFPDGVDIVLKPRKGPELDKLSMKFRARFGTTFSNQKTLREHMREVGMLGAAKGGRSRAKKLNACARASIAKNAANVRWKATRIRGMAIRA